MVEQFLAGPQVSTESIVLDGIAYTPGFADRNYEFMERYAPNFVENGGDMPSHLSASIQQKVRDLVQKAAASLGVKRGVVKGDIVVSGGRPYVIELAARLSGGYFCTHEIPLNTGVDTVDAMIRLSLGLNYAPELLRPRYQRGVCLRYLFPPPGKVVAVHGADRICRMDGVEIVQITARPGDVFARPVDSNSTAAMVIATGKTRVEARERALAAISIFKMEVEPL